MAAIERSIFGLAAIFFAFGTPLRADRAADLRSQISHIATALTAGNAADAMAPFDSSFADSEQLSRYFQGLAVYQIDNEIDVLDEQDTENAATLTVSWSLTLTDRVTGATQRRNAEIKVRFLEKNGKWKIVDFSPIGIFQPEWKRPATTE